MGGKGAGQRFPIGPSRAGRAQTRGCWAGLAWLAPRSSGLDVREERVHRVVVTLIAAFEVCSLSFRPSPNLLSSLSMPPARVLCPGLYALLCSTCPAGDPPSAARRALCPPHDGRRDG